MRFYYCLWFYFYYIRHYIFFFVVVIYTLRSVIDVTEGITQESPMGDSWVIPRKVDKMV